MPAPSMNRDQSPVAILLDPQKDIALGERDIRLEDYLNDKFQVPADFENLESILASVEIQKEQLDKQVSPF
jgi:hypothetical protein